MSLRALPGRQQLIAADEERRVRSQTGSRKVA